MAQRFTEEPMMLAFTTLYQQLRLFLRLGVWYQQALTVGEIYGLSAIF